MTIVDRASATGASPAGGQGGNASRFLFLPPRFFSCPPSVFFWEEEVSVIGRKKRQNLRFRPEKAFGLWRRPFFFWRSPAFGRKIGDFGQKKPSHFGENLCPPDFNFVSPISRRWRRPWFATEAVDSGSIPGRVKPKTTKIGIHSFPA